MTVVVDAYDTGISYYLSMPAEKIAPVLGTDPALLFSDDGAVPIDRFREDGSFEMGDDVFRRLEGRVANAPALFETMSMMVHPLSDPAPFQTPWDAVMATAVCNVEYKADDLIPGALQLYYGSYAHDVDGKAGMDLTFPETGREEMQVTLYLYRDGEFIGQDKVTVADGGTIAVALDDRAGLSFLWWGTAVLWGLVVLAAVVAPRLRTPRNSHVGSSA
ncbi:MAG: hypothetical protein AAGA28_19330 [Pseudomonadota bacterium]